MKAIKIAIHRLPHGRGLPLPAHATKFSAGVDLLAALEKNVEMEPGARAVIPSAIAVALPFGYEAQVRPRSGLAAKHGVTVLNSPGTIDADYRGEIKVILINLGDETFTIERGMRIAQMVVSPVNMVAWSEVESLPESARAENGFGSTGISEEG